MTREEELWAAIVAALKNENYAGELPAAPSWRSEEFLMGILAGIKGVSGAKVPEPVWNEEKYLAAIFDQVNGGVAKCKLLASKEFTVNTSSTSDVTVGSFNVPELADLEAIIYVKVRDKAGKRWGYFRGGDNFVERKVGTSAVSSIKYSFGVSNSGSLYVGTGTYGVFVGGISDSGDVTIKAKYSSSYGAINGTYVVEVYALSWPKDDSPFK
jgi:hypothetical protein